MELKHKLQGFGDVAGTLLIVPYGIETLQAPISCLPPAIF